MANTPHIPAHISQIVAELNLWITAATQSGISDDHAFVYSQHEDAVHTQLSVLGWDAVLNEVTQRWVPCPASYTIVHNFPDPLYYPQRCYKLPEHPDRWEYIWKEGTKMGFPSWDEAYVFLFIHDVQTQEDLPLRHYEIRASILSPYTHYAARTAAQAVQIYLNRRIEENQLTPADAVRQTVSVYEYRTGLRAYCDTCQQAPCSVFKCPIPTTE